MKLLELLKVNPNTTHVELSNKLNVSRRTISILLANLKEKGKLKELDQIEKVIGKYCNNIKRSSI